MEEWGPCDRAPHAPPQGPSRCVAETGFWVLLMPFWGHSKGPVSQQQHLLAASGSLGTISPSTWWKNRDLEKQEARPQGAGLLSVSLRLCSTNHLNSRHDHGPEDQTVPGVRPYSKTHKVQLCGSPVGWLTEFPPNWKIALLLGL